MTGLTDAGKQWAKQVIAKLNYPKEAKQSFYSQVDSVSSYDGLFQALPFLKDYTSMPGVSVSTAVATDLNTAVIASDGDSSSGVSVVSLQSLVGSADDLPDGAENVIGALATMRSDMNVLTNSDGSISELLNSVNASASTAQTAATAAQDTADALTTLVGSVSITDITTATGGAVADTVTAVVVAIDDKFGDMTTLTTNEKSNVTNAINEIDANADAAQTAATAAQDTADALTTLVGSTSITAVTTATGGAVADTVTAVVVAIDDKFGDMTTLTTNSKNTVVYAINEVDANADAAQTTANTAQTTANTVTTLVGSTSITAITTATGGAVADTVTAVVAATDAKFGDMTTLTTNSKSTVVYAINEVDANADAAQTTANTAQTTANTVTTLVGSSSINNVASTVTGAIGNSALTTIATTLSGAVVEMNADSWVTSSKIADGTITASDLSSNSVTTSKVSSAAITSAKQGFATWKVTNGVDSWDGHTDTLNSPISGCSSGGTIGDSSTYYSMVASSPSNGDHVDFKDYLAITVQCGQHCSTANGLENCFNWFFDFA